MLIGTADTAVLPHANVKYHTVKFDVELHVSQSAMQLW